MYGGFVWYVFELIVFVDVGVVLYYVEIVVDIVGVEISECIFKGCFVCNVDGVGL